MKKHIIYIVWIAASLLLTSCANMAKPDSESLLIKSAFSQDKEEKSSIKLIPKIKVCDKLQVVLSIPKGWFESEE